MDVIVLSESDCCSKLVYSKPRFSPRLQETMFYYCSCYSWKICISISWPSWCISSFYRCILLCFILKTFRQRS